MIGVLAAEGTAKYSERQSRNREDCLSSIGWRSGLGREFSQAELGTLNP